MIKLKSISKKYNHYFHLEIGELSVNRGDRFVLLGPSGAGKSTLLRIMHGIEDISNGDVIFDGVNFNETDMVSAIRKMSMVFQRPEFFDNSIEFNISYPLTIRNEVVGDKVDKILELVSLKIDKRKNIRDISGGELQRVAIARALITDPKVIFLDEPTSNLDPYNVKLIEKIIQDANQLGKTIIVVTHDPFQAKRIGGRVALIIDGRIIEVGSKEKFFKDPKDNRTSKFLNGELL